MQRHAAFGIDGISDSQIASADDGDMCTRCDGSINPGLIDRNEIDARPGTDLPGHVESEASIRSHGNGSIAAGHIT